jgi:FAD/FMN-containing dehydrogenase
LIASRPTTDLTSWGRVIRSRQDVVRPYWRDELADAVRVATASPGHALAVGLSRSYGDSGLNPEGAVIAMAGLDRVLDFDVDTGVLRADAGLTLDQVIRLALPHGWFPALVPGTKFVTLGGAIANDIHGKNHHRAGTFGQHVRRIALHRTDGSISELIPGEPLFAATVGGLGLTGVIAWAEIQLTRVAGAWLDNEDIAFHSLDDFFRLATDSASSHEVTVAWIDCTAGAKGIFSRANWTSDQDRTLHDPPKIKAPFDAPAASLNPLTLKAFNTAYYGLKSARRGLRKSHYESVFFPLDAIDDWNRLYGPKGFYQYQCVVPPQTARDAIAELLRQIARSGQGSFLAVLKTFGHVPSPGLLSFPMEGSTLALDFRNRGEATLQLLARFDAVVHEAGGRLYPAKDGRISAQMFAEGYPQLGEFVRYVDPGLSSAFWRRVRP